MDRERKGGAHKSKRIIVRISESHGDALAKQAQRYKKPELSKKDIVEYLIELNERYDLVKVGWEKRINEALAQVKNLELEDIPEDACPALQRVNGILFCIWARKNAPPQVRKLSPDLNEALKACLGCARTREILDGIGNLEETIRTMKERAKRGIVVKVPRCIHEPPGVLSEDGLSFWCRMGAQNITVDKCNKLRNGQPCRYLKWMSVPVKGELTDPEK